jgi:hypothetical protein
VYDGLVGPWFLPPFLETTGLDRLEYVVLLPGVERCVERVTTRSGHGFTDEEATRHMHRQFLKSTIDPRHVILDPSDDPGELADLVAEALERGGLTFPGSRTAPAP